MFDGCATNFTPGADCSDSAWFTSPASSIATSGTLMVMVGVANVAVEFIGVSWR